MSHEICTFSSLERRTTKYTAQSNAHYVHISKGTSDNGSFYLLNLTGDKGSSQKKKNSRRVFIIFTIRCQHRKMSRWPPKSRMYLLEVLLQFKERYFPNIFTQSPPSSEPSVGVTVSPHRHTHMQSQRLGIVQPDHKNQTTSCRGQLAALGK